VEDFQLNQINILLIEDNSADARLIRENLLDTQENFHLEWKERLSSALSFPAEKNVDAIVVDLNLPDSRGLDTFTKINEKFPEKPIIVLTGLNDKELAYRAVREGAQDYLVKGEMDGRLLGRCIRYSIERKQADKALRESEAKYHLLVESLNQGIWMIDENAVTIFVNPRMAEMLGYKAEEMLSRHLFSFIDKPCIQIATQKLALRRQGIRERHDFEFIHKDGSRIYTRLETSPIIDIDGNYRGALAGVQDITENKRAEKALRETKDYLDKLISYANAPIVVWDPQQRITRFNSAFERLTGYYAEEVLGKDLSMLFPEASREASLRKIESSLRGKQWVSMEISILNNKTKEVRIVLWNSASICSESGELQAVIAQGQDITELRHAADELQLANKKFQLLSSITRHDILNQITVLQIYLDLAKENSLDTSSIDYLQKLETATKEILRHIEFTRQYEKPMAVKPTWQEVSVAIAEASSGRLPVLDECRGLSVYVDPIIEKVFSNLMDNSIQHGERSTQVHTYYRTLGEDITIIWEDDGIGIPDDEKKLIFLKGFGKNTGFGLYLCKESLSITGIGISETGKYGKGARFEIRVPCGMWRMIGTDKG
jgi:PAS domain S-box-containing protein